jgi:hypothetical protein
LKQFTVYQFEALNPGAYNMGLEIGKLKLFQFSAQPEPKFDTEST